MNTRLFMHGFQWHREARLIGQQPIENTKGPEKVSPPDAQPEVAKETPLTVEKLPAEIQRVQEATQNVVLSETEALQMDIQKNLDARLTSPNIPETARGDFLRNLNDQQLHARGLHAGAVNGRVTLSSFTPPTPEQIAKKQRVAELENQLRQINIEINETNKMTFKQNAAEYRLLKAQSRGRFNIAPEIARMRAQLPAEAMRESLRPMAQLYYERAQIQRELAGVKSGRIPVNIPKPPEEPAPKDQFVSHPLGPDAPSSTETAANLEKRVFELVDRWQKADSLEVRDTIEGFLMMENIDIEKSDLKKVPAVIVAALSGDRAGLFLAGLLQVLKSFADRFSNKKTPVDSLKKADVETMTSEERTREIALNDTKMEDLTKKKESINADIVKIETKMNAPANEGNEKVKQEIQAELKQKQDELKAVETEMKSLTERNKALREAKSTPTKNVVDLLTPGELAKDSFANDFGSMKEKMKLSMHSYVEKIADSSNPDRFLSVARRLFNIDEKLIGSAEAKGAVKENTKVFLEKFINAMQLQGSRDGHYRMKLDLMLLKDGMRGMEMFKNASFQTTPERLQKIAEEISQRGQSMNAEEGNLVTGFMKKAEISANFVRVSEAIFGNGTEAGKKGVEAEGQKSVPAAKESTFDELLENVSKGVGSLRTRLGEAAGKVRDALDPEKKKSKEKSAEPAKSEKAPETKNVKAAEVEKLLNEFEETLNDAFRTKKHPDGKLQEEILEKLSKLIPDEIVTDVTPEGLSAANRAGFDDWVRQVKEAAANR